MRGPAKGRERELLTGLFVLLGFFAIAVFAFRLTDSPLFSPGIQVTTYLDDATGLFKLTKIKQAGISIGYVKEIELENGRAKLTLIIEHPYSLPKNARVTPRPLGILGDKYLEVTVPGQESQQGYDVSPQPSGDSQSLYRLRSIWSWIVADAAAADESNKAPTPPSVGPKLKQGDVIKSGGSSGSMDDLARELQGTTKELQATTKSLHQLIDGSSGDIAKILRSWAEISTKIEKALGGVDSQQTKRDLHDLSATAGRVSRTLENVENITAKIDRGEGTLGKLVNDPTTADELARSLTYLNHAIERSRRIQTVVDMDGQYGVKSEATKTYVSLKIMTRETSGYIAQLVVDPAGTTKKVIERTRTDEGPTVTKETVTNDRSALKYSVQFLKKIGDTAFRLGLFESSGGAGVDWFLMHDRLQLTMEFWDVSREGNNPHVKAFVRIPFLTYLYAEFGGDDLMTRVNSGDSRRTLMAGLGLRFTDDDIKTLFLLPGIP